MIRFSTEVIVKVGVELTCITFRGVCNILIPHACKWEGQKKQKHI